MRFLRLRRLRKTSIIRDWFSETCLYPQDIILPYFVVPGKNVREPLNSMPGVYHLSIENLLKDIEDASGIHAILLFGIPDTKDEKGSQAYRKDGIVQRAVKAVKREHNKLIVITDVCLCGYTSHGHCGVLNPAPRRNKIASREIRRSQRQEFEIDNDETLKILAEISLSHAQAGVDFVAPSAMMDGEVMAIREALDRKGFKDTGILAYSAKYASNFYGPFRDALDSAPEFGDRASYQMNFRNSDEALREIKSDIDEGADIVMVKPALAYLDVISRARERFNVPIAAYNVSGEYAMVKAYCEKIKAKSEREEVEKKIVLEILFSIKRAGADFIITYHGKEVIRWLKNV